MKQRVIGARAIKTSPSRRRVAERLCACGCKTDLPPGHSGKFMTEYCRVKAKWGSNRKPGPTPFSIRRPMR